MNNAKMWLVVKPTVGVPLFLGGVAVTSLAVHVAVISSGVGTWYGPYVTGGAGAEESAALSTDEAILPDGRTATLLVDDLTQAALQ
jgi:light-harvesting protein B-800-850 alpha chain